MIAAIGLCVHCNHERVAVLIAGTANVHGQIFEEFAYVSAALFALERVMPTFSSDVHCECPMGSRAQLRHVTCPVSCAGVSVCCLYAADRRF